MSRTLEALETARIERGERQGQSSCLANNGLYALPSVSQAVSVADSRLLNAGWLCALADPPEQSRQYSALADYLRIRLKPPAGILVCGVDRKSGATASSLNLSTELALSGPNTVMFCELPGKFLRIQKILGSSCQYGLWDHLSREVALHDVLLRTQIPQLVLLPGKGIRTPKLDVPTYEKLNGFFEELKNRHPDRYVVVDARPVLDSVLTVGLASRFDAVVLVVSAGTSQEKVKAAKKTLGCCGLCVVLINRVRGRFFHGC